MSRVKVGLFWVCAIMLFASPTAAQSTDGVGNCKKCVHEPWEHCALLVATGFIHCQVFSNPEECVEQDACSSGAFVGDIGMSGTLAETATAAVFAGSATDVRQGIGGVERRVCDQAIVRRPADPGIMSDVLRATSSIEL